MIEWIVWALAKPLGQAGAILLGAITLYGAWHGWLWQHDNKIEAKAKAEVVGSLNSSAEKLGHEAVKARAPALRPGAATRLRESACRDC